MDASYRLSLAYLIGHPVEAARRLESVAPQDAATLLKPFEAREIAGVVEHLLPDIGANVLAYLPPQAAADALAHVTSSAAIGLLRQCRPDVQADLLARLDPTVSSTIRRSLTYPEQTAGSLADPQILTLAPDLTARDAIERVTRDHGRATYYIYVLDREAKLTGVVSLKQLLAADSDDLVGTVMSRKLISLSASSTIDELLSHPNWRAYHTMPVVDRAGAFLGALRYRTLRALEEQGSPAERPASLSGALLALWEAYALAGIRVMTDVAGAMAPAMSQQAHPTDTTPETREHSNADTEHLA